MDPVYSATSTGESRSIHSSERANSAPRHADGPVMGPGGMGGAVAALSE